MNDQLGGNIAASDFNDWLSNPPVFPLPALPLPPVLSPLLPPALAPVVTGEEGTTAPYSPAPIDDWPGKKDLNQRFCSRHCSTPSNDDIRKFNSRVCVWTKDTEHVVHCGNSEFYLISKLSERDHSFENMTPLPSSQTGSRMQAHYPQLVDHFSEDVSVVRGGSEMYSRHFGHLRLDIPTLIRFILNHGECNAKRDGIDAINGGKRRRVTFGCCGQCWVPSEDGSHCPISTYGCQIFDNESDDPELASVKEMIAAIIDAMQDCEDEIEMKHLRNSKPFGYAERTSQFGEALRDKLGAKRFRREDITLQLKCLSKGERTARHKDDLNDYRKGYEKTATFSGSTVDAFGDTWSVKVVANSRLHAGCHLDNRLQLTPILTRARRQVETLNHELENFQQRHSGRYQYPEKLTYKTFPLVVLDDDCPWEDTYIDGGLSVHRMSFPARGVRDTQLSAPTTIVYLHHQTLGYPADGGNN